MPVKLAVLKETRAFEKRVALVPAVADKLAKQFKYASKKDIPFVLVIGEEEQAKGLVTVKNMQTGEQQTITLDQVIDKLS